MALERAQIVKELRVLFAVERNVDVVVAVPFFVTRLAIHRRFVDRIGGHNRGSRIEVC
jgi:hypothetical protein